MAVQTVLNKENFNKIAEDLKFDLEKFYQKLVECKEITSSSPSVLKKIKKGELEALFESDLTDLYNFHMSLKKVYFDLSVFYNRLMDSEKGELAAGWKILLEIEGKKYFPKSVGDVGLLSQILAKISHQLKIQNKNFGSMVITKERQIKNHHVMTTKLNLDRNRFGR